MDPSTESPRLIKSAIGDGVATITFDRPDKRNALTGPMLDQLADAVDAAGADPEVRSMVLGGEGGAFCAGLDLDAFSADPPPAWMPSFRESSLRSHLSLYDFPHPIVTAFEKYGINGGSAFALAGDLIVAGTGSFLQIGEVRMGMAVPMNLAWLRLRHPPRIAEQLALTGRRIYGPELASKGIACEVVDDGDVFARALELATEIASFPNGGASGIKAAIRTLGRDDPRSLFAEALELNPPPAMRMADRPRL